MSLTGEPVNGPMRAGFAVSCACCFTARRIASSINFATASTTGTTTALPNWR